MKKKDNDKMIVEKENNIENEEENKNKKFGLEQNVDEIVLSNEMGEKEKENEVDL